MPVPPPQATEHALCLCELCAFVVYSPPHDPPQHWQDASATRHKLQNTPSAFVISVLLWFTPLLTITTTLARGQCHPIQATEHASAFVISVLLWFTPLLTIHRNTGKMPVPPKMQATRPSAYVIAELLWFTPSSRSTTTLSYPERVLSSFAF